MRSLEVAKLLRQYAASDIGWDAKYWVERTAAELEARDVDLDKLEKREAPQAPVFAKTDPVFDETDPVFDETDSEAPAAADAAEKIIEKNLDCEWLTF